MRSKGSHERQSREGCSTMRPSYEDEEKIVWIKDRETLAAMRYVREKSLLCKIRTGPIRPPEGEILIGYAVLKKTAAKADEKGFCRRIFTLRPEEMGCDSKNLIVFHAPEEAVDPLSVQAGKPSKKALNNSSHFCSHM
jgi:hypothetical protein